MALTGDLTAEVGHDVTFAFAVTNGGTDAVELRYRSGLAIDVAVREGDTEVWRWSDGRMATQALWSETLAPGESVEREATWTDPVPGSYEATATLEATNADVEARARFEV